MFFIFTKIKNLIFTVTALCLCLVIALAVHFKNSLKLTDLEGERSFYLNSASSQSLIVHTLTPFQIYRVRGESVRFDRDDRATEQLLDEILKKYAATLIFTEQTNNITSYYCYTPQWKETVTLNGKPINLHLAVSEQECAVGTPIIFGGF